MGHEFSGTVERLGDGVTRFAVGEEVYGWTTPPHGSHADHVVVTEDRIAPSDRRGLSWSSTVQGIGPVSRSAGSPRVLCRATWSSPVAR
ncbi:alcohol dehydrogenase catalytic domain-containing protein (plasmid) [Streptomyces sp. CA-294286]|uniref:alcohol dehydrogenase catalytic domain-containing protein n=1 Tax=Streptomyces sp. CA-294286 TaxID=3240070 RepID=UPI003D914B0A